MMVDVQSPIFINPDFVKLRMSNNNTSWFDNDIAAFLNVSEDGMEFPQSVPSSSPIADQHYYATSSPEQFNSPDASPYSSDVSQTPSPFDATLFAESPQSTYTGSIDVDPSLFEPGNLTNPLLLPEIEKILAATPYSQPQIELSAPQEHTTSKKRQREDIKSDVSLSREQLLTMTSKEIEDYVNQLKTKRTLTASEEKDLKRQRRLVKNREYASQSRNRKKQYVDEIEKQLDQAKAETDAIRKQNQALVEENKLLKKQLGNIADAIKKSQNGTANLSSSSGNGVGVFAKFATIGGGRNNASRTVSACLLAICFMVFTFATFWNIDEPFGAKLFPSENFVFAGPRRLLWNQFESEPVIPDNYYPTPPKLTLHDASSLVSTVVVEPVLACASLLAKSMCSPNLCSAENSTCSYPDQGLLVS
jgi:hypothetical protein